MKFLTFIIVVVCKTRRFDDFRVKGSKPVESFSTKCLLGQISAAPPHNPSKMAYFLSYASLFLVVSFSYLPGHCQAFSSGFSSRNGRQSLPRPLQTQSRQHRPMKSVVNYLGTDFLLQDGCPEPRCDPTKVINSNLYVLVFFKI